VVVRVNDRGPTSRERIGDVSQAAARELDMLRAGVVEARLEVLVD
jgi:rare lipoprotein A